MKKTASKVSVGPVREDGTFRMHITKEDGTNTSMRLSVVKKEKIPTEEDVLAKVKALQKKQWEEDPDYMVKMIRGDAESRRESTTPHRHNRLLRFGWERGLWRLYLLGVAIWGIAIAGLLILPILDSGRIRIHGDVIDSGTVALIVLPSVLAIYFIGRELIINAIWPMVIKAIWPLMKWVIEGFTQK